MPKFEVFDKRRIPLAKTPYVTMQKRGTVTFNQAAWATMGSPKAVELLWAAEDQIMGIRACDPNEEHAYPIRGANLPKGPFVLSATAFTKYYGIPTEQSLRRKAYLDGDVLCIDFKDPGVPVISNRNGHVKKEASEVPE